MIIRKSTDRGVKSTERERQGWRSMFISQWARENEKASERQTGRFLAPNRAFI